MKKRAIALLISGISSISIHAQTSVYTNFADSIFQNLDKTPITTGLLYDRVYPAAGLHAFNINIDTVHSDLVQQAYFEMYYAAYAPGNRLKPSDLSYIRDVENFEHRVPIGVVDFYFNLMDTLALDNNLFTWQNGLLYDVPGRPYSPYWLRRVQMASPLSETISPGTVTFSLPSELILNNQNLLVQNVQLNFPGVGIISLQPNTVGTLQFNGGSYTGTITVTYSDNTSFTNILTLQVSSNDNSRILTDVPTCWDEDKYSTILFQGYDEPQPYRGKNIVSYYYRLNDPSIICRAKNPIKKPIIIVDGYDPTDERDATRIYNDLMIYYDISGSKHNLAENLQMQGYDIVIVNMPDYEEGTVTINTPNGPITKARLVHGGADYIERNSMVLVKIIQDINAELITNGSSEQIVLVGPSMGGQITRYALRYMETQPNMNHNCRLWISMDSPHEGAALPIGLQNLVEQLGGLVSQIRDLQTLAIDPPAAKQMLIHHHLAHSEVPLGAPGFFNTYYNGINSLGWPQNLRKVAINSGAHSGLLQSPGSPCTDALTFNLKGKNYFLKLFMNVLLGSIYIDAPIRFSPDHNASRCVVSDIAFGNRNYPTYAQHTTSLYNASLDLLPGGFIPSFREFANDATKGLGKLEKYIRVQVHLWSDNHAHELTGSTLAYGLGPTPNPNRKWDDDIRHVNLVCLGEVPWDAYQGPPDFNLRHDSLYEEQALWIQDEINGIQHNNKIDEQVAIDHDDLSGHWCGGDTRTFWIRNANLYPGATYNWSLLFPNCGLQITSGQGTSTITVQYDGNIDCHDPFQLIVNGESTCYYLFGSNQSPVNLIPYVQQPYGTYGCNNSYNHTLRFGDREVNITNCTTNIRITPPSPYNTTATYQLLNNPPIAYTWSQNNGILTVSAQLSQNPNNYFRFSISWVNECGERQATQYFNLFFLGQGTKAIQTEEEVNILVDDAVIAQNAEIFDASGKLVSKKPVKNNGKTITVDTKNLANGIYILKVWTDKGLIVQKIFINH